MSIPSPCPCWPLRKSSTFAVAGDGARGHKGCCALLRVKLEWWIHRPVQVNIELNSLAESLGAQSMIFHAVCHDGLSDLLPVFQSLRRF